MKLEFHQHKTANFHVDLFLSMQGTTWLSDSAYEKTWRNLLELILENVHQATQDSILKL